MQTTSVIVWIYGALVLAGGLMGWVQARSKPSLIAGIAFGVTLIATGFCPYARLVGATLAAVLGAIMSMRFSKTKKFIPAGLMTVLSLIVFVVLLALPVVLK